MVVVRLKGPWQWKYTQPASVDLVRCVVLSLWREHGCVVEPQQPQTQHHKPTKPHTNGCDVKIARRTIPILRIPLVTPQSCLLGTKLVTCLCESLRPRPWARSNKWTTCSMRRFHDSHSCCPWVFTQLAEVRCRSSLLLSISGLVSDLVSDLHPSLLS
jgi:hypothetical protein